MTESLQVEWLSRGLLRPGRLVSFVSTESDEPSGLAEEVRVELTESIEDTLRRI